MNKLLVTLLASAFALTAFAQAPKSDTASKAPASAEAKKSDKKTAKTEKKSKAKAKDEKKSGTK
jgi:Ni/Co efflux regulator RcnB